MTKIPDCPIYFVPYAVPKNAEDDATMKAFRTAQLREELYDVVIDQYHPSENFQKIQKQEERRYQEAGSPMQIILYGQGLTRCYKEEMSYASSRLGRDVPNYVGRPKTCPISRRVELADKIVQVNLDILHKLETCGLSSDMEAELKRDVTFYAKQLEYHYAEIGDAEKSLHYREIARQITPNEEEGYNIANNLSSSTEYDYFVPIHDRVVRIDPEAFHQTNELPVLAANPKTGEILLDNTKMLSTNMSEKTNPTNNLIEALFTRSEQPVPDVDIVSSSDFTR